jgi:hypothetical protein
MVSDAQAAPLTILIVDRIPWAGPCAVDRVAAFGEPLPKLPKPILFDPGNDAVTFRSHVDEYSFASAPFMPLSRIQLWAW